MTLEIGDERQGTDLSRHEIGNELFEIRIESLLFGGLQCDHVDNEQDDLAYLLVHEALVDLAHHHCMDRTFGKHFERFATARHEIELFRMRNLLDRLEGVENEASYDWLAFFAVELFHGDLE